MLNAIRFPLTIEDTYIGPYSYRVIDADKCEIAASRSKHNAQTVIAALNNTLNNHTRRTDPQTSRDAEQSMSAKMRNKYRLLGLEFFGKEKVMSDERLADAFQLAEVPITEARIRHIRLELERMGLIKVIPNATAQTKTGRNCRAFQLTSAGYEQLKREI